MIGLVVLLAVVALMSFIVGFGFSIFLFLREARKIRW